jgi:SAM-dependent methyltransferase
MFFQEEGGKFSLTPVGELLKSGPSGLRAMAIHLCEPNSWKPWGDLLHAVQTGQLPFKHIHGEDIFEFYPKHPESFEPFNEAMTNYSMYAAEAVTAAYDFTGIGTLVDVGAGHGTLLRAILRANPALKGIAFDLPSVVDGVRAIAAEPGMAGRLEIAGGDFFVSVPSGDAHILKTIIHDWDDDRSAEILRSIHRAQKPGGKLILVEIVITDGPVPRWENSATSICWFFQEVRNEPLRSTGSFSKDVAIVCHECCRRNPCSRSLKACEANSGSMRGSRERWSLYQGKFLDLATTPALRATPPVRREPELNHSHLL